MKNPIFREKVHENQYIVGELPKKGGLNSLQV